MKMRTNGKHNHSLTVFLFEQHDGLVKKVQEAPWKKTLRKTWKRLK